MTPLNGPQLEQEVLLWIAEEIPADGNPLEITVPVKMLILRLALSNRPAEDLTQSVKISLDDLQKANLIRVFRRYGSQGVLDLLDHNGRQLTPTDPNEPAQLRLTQKGYLEAKRLAQLRVPKDEDCGA